MPELSRSPAGELGGLTRHAAEGDERAWTELVTGLDGVLRAVVKGYRLRPADAEDVIQTTWLQAVRHVKRLNEPEAIAGWLIVTARREAMRTLQRGAQEVLSDEPRPASEEDPACPQTLAIARQRRAAVRRAVDRLSGRQRALLAAMLNTPAPSYEQLSAQLGMPLGSIGPTRDRALERLRNDNELKGW